MISLKNDYFSETISAVSTESIHWKNEILRPNKEASLLVRIIDQSEFTYNLLNIRRVFRFLPVYFLELKLFALYVQ